MKFPLGIQTFSQIREQGYQYVDKTAHIVKLIETGKVYFLARPRRFGKSLLVSTLESVFAGEQALFDGLSIAQSDYDFAAFPVIKIEFSGVVVNEPQDFARFVVNVCDEYAAKFDIKLTIDSFEQRFAELIKKLQAKCAKNVVLLIDEYDKPILDNILKPQLQSLRPLINGFYSVVKSLDQYLHFVFITGVSKFAKVSVFSGMNHLTDISMDVRFADICGITQHQLEHYFEDGLAQLMLSHGNNQQASRADLLLKIKIWYNGYCFHPDGLRVYNPYSLLSLLSKLEFKNFWFSTATPTFLLDLLQHKQYPLQELTELAVGESTFDACEPEEMSVQGVFIQTGYLTIKQYVDGLYQLDFPNLEVKRSFFESVATRFGQLDHGQGASYSSRLVSYLNHQDLDGFFETLRVFFANIPYEINIKHEKYYQSLFYAILKVIGFSLQVEVSTNVGRIDCVIETESHIFVIEFKLNGSKEEALSQIVNNKYAQRYQQNGKKKVLLGVEFNQQTRNIGDFVRG